MQSKQQSKTIKQNKNKDQEKDFELEKTLEYKTSDGGRGWIVRIRSLK